MFGETARNQSGKPDSFIRGHRSISVKWYYEKTKSMLDVGRNIKLHGRIYCGRC